MKRGLADTRGSRFVYVSFTPRGSWNWQASPRLLFSIDEGRKRQILLSESFPVDIKTMQILKYFFPIKIFVILSSDL